MDEEEEEKREGAAKHGRDKREGTVKAQPRKRKATLERREESRGEFVKQWSVIGGFRSRSAFLSCEDIE